MYLAAFMLLFSLTAPSQTSEAAKPEKPSLHSSQTEVLTDHVLVAPPGLLYQGVPAEIPQDEGLPGLRLELLRLGTTARLMQVVAHPDDED